MSKTIVDLKDVSIFQKKNLVLSDINLTIEKGDFVYLIGKTGSGKSSLLKVLYVDLTLQKGSGKVVDFDLSSLKESEIPYLRIKIGIFFSNMPILNLKINKIILINCFFYIIYHFRFCVRICKSFNFIKNILFIDHTKPNRISFLVHY